MNFQLISPLLIELVKVRLDQLNHLTVLISPIYSSDKKSLDNLIGPIPCTGAARDLKTSISSRLHVNTSQTLQTNWITVEALQRFIFNTRQL